MDVFVAFRHNTVGSARKTQVTNRGTSSRGAYGRLGTELRATPTQEGLMPRFVRVRGEDGILYEMGFNRSGGEITDISVELYGKSASSNLLRRDVPDYATSTNNDPAAVEAVWYDHMLPALLAEIGITVEVEPLF